MVDAMRSACINSKEGRTREQRQETTKNRISEGNRLACVSPTFHCKRPIVSHGVMWRVWRRNSCDSRRAFGEQKVTRASLSFIADARVDSDCGCDSRSRVAAASSAATTEEQRERLLLMLLHE